MCIVSQSFFGLGQGAEILIELSDSEKRKKVEVKGEDGKKDKLPLYFDGETVAGTVKVNLKGKKLEHQGIRVEFVGQIGQCSISTHYLLAIKVFLLSSEMFQDRSNHHDFLSLVRQLSPPGEITSAMSFPFEFLSVDKPYETYSGINVGLR